MVVVVVAVVAVVAGSETFVAKFWERAPTPPPGHRGRGASVLNLRGCGVLRGGEGKESAPAPSPLNVCFVPENKGSIRLLPPGKHKTSF